jgi:hypothetical protein
MKIPLWILAHFQNSKSSLHFCGLLHTSSTPFWRSIFSTERSVVMGSLCTPFAPAQCPPGRALRILNDSVFCLQTLSRVLLQHHCAYARCPLGRALQNSQQNYVCNYVFSHMALPPRYSATLRFSLL